MSVLSEKRNRSLVAHLCLWAVLCIALALVSWLSPKALFFGGVSPVPLRANPTLLTIGVASAPACLLLLYVADRSSSLSKFVLAIISFAAAVFCVGAILIALYPGPGSLVARDLIEQPENRQSPSVFAFPVFFGNNERSFQPAEEQRLKDAFAVFRSCEAGTLRVRGFASSASFPKNSDGLNLKLANDRAQAVKRTLDKLDNVSAVVQEWDSFEHMAGKRRLRDTTLDGERIRKLEGYNRRAEVFWSDSLCLDIEREISSPPAQPTTVAEAKN